MDLGLLVSLFWNGMQCGAKEKNGERQTSLFASGNTVRHFWNAVMKLEQKFWLSLLFSGSKENISYNKWIISKRGGKKKLFTRLTSTAALHKSAFTSTHCCLLGVCTSVCLTSPNLCKLSCSNSPMHIHMRPAWCVCLSCMCWCTLQNIIQEFSRIT